MRFGAAISFEMLCEVVDYEEESRPGKILRGKRRTVLKVDASMLTTGN
jgi:hypothetical protein